MAALVALGAVGGAVGDAAWTTGMGAPPFTPMSVTRSSRWPTARTAGAPRFTLVTAQAGINARFVPAPGYPPENAVQTGGASVGDFNNDARPDLYLPSGGTGPDKLYINQGDGTFTDEAAAWGVNRWTRASGSAVADYNADGLLDLYVVSYGDFPGPASPGRCILYKNLGPDGSGLWRFEDVGVRAGVNEVFDAVGGMGAAFGDMDLDGDPDLFVSTWVFAPGGNRLFRNDGDGSFTDISHALPPEKSPLRGFTPNFADLNGDRYPELLLTNDFRTSRLYLNAGRDARADAVFSDVTQPAGIDADCNGMGATLADFDADGRLDWFMTNIYVPQTDPPCTNTLYRSVGADATGTPMFEEVAVSSGVADAGWAWGTTAFDADNDGDTDLGVTGGWPGWPNAPARLYLNDGSGSFTDGAADAGLAWTGQGRGLVHLDYNGDGRVDLLFADNGGAYRLYRNDTPGGGGEDAGGFLRIDLDTRGNPCLAPRGAGAKVFVTVGGVTQYQQLDSRTTYLGQSERTLHFGVGGATVVDFVDIEWPDGSLTMLTGVAPNQRLVIEVFHPADFDENERLDFFDVALFLTAFNAGDLRADFDRDGTVSPADVPVFLARFVDPCGG